MSSSPVASPPVEPDGLVRPGLLELFEQVADPRARRGVRHRFAGLLSVALAAVLAGARSLTAIGEWVADAKAGVLAKLGIAARRRPCAGTIRRALARLDPDLLDAVLGAWMRTRVGVLGGRRVIAIDGKTVRGARAAGHLAPHLVAALDHTLGVVLGHVQVAVKSNEIPALRTLLNAFDLVNAVVTADAHQSLYGTRHETARRAWWAPSHPWAPCRVSRLSEALIDSAMALSALEPTLPIDRLTSSCSQRVAKSLDVY